MINTFELITLVYLMVGFIVAINFVCTEKEKKTTALGIVVLFGIFVIPLWPFYVYYKNDNA